MKYKRQIKIVIVIAILGIAGATWAVQNKWIHAKAVQTNKRLIEHSAKSDKNKKVYDPVLLNKFKMVSALLDIKNKACTYSGILNITNKADSTQNVSNLNFVCCINGTSCYYKMGNTETLNNKGIYLMVDHAEKKIFLGPQKAITTPEIVGGNKLNKALLGENYDLTLKTEGKYQTLTLLNERHITCKEYAVTYDTVSLKVTRIYARMSEFTDPLNKNKEKILDVLFNNWDNNADIDKHINVYKILAEEGKTLQATPEYKNYELIRLR